MSYRFREEACAVRNKEAGFIIIFLVLAFFGALLSCATDQAPLLIENSLPQDELAYYSDDFDYVREDLWTRAGYLYRKEQMQNFKLAGQRFENGKLIIGTQTGSFSKGGLSSKFALSGDFDIRLNFRMGFIKGVPSWDMDQMFGLGAFDKSKKFGKMSFVTIGLYMKGGRDQGFIYSDCTMNGKKKGGNSQKIGNFNGTFRILRTGKTIRTLYRIKGALDWIKMNSFRATDNDMLIGFQVRNFFAKRTNIRAQHSISMEFDRLK